MKVYEGRPSTDWDRSKESDVDVPVISHESGQRCVYPDFREIGKYTGPVEARNFELWREMLTANGMGDQAHDFFRASGALTVVEYKRDRALLRSSNRPDFSSCRSTTSRARVTPRWVCSIRSGTPRAW